MVWLIISFVVIEVFLLSSFQLLPSIVIPIIYGIAILRKLRSLRSASCIHVTLHGNDGGKYKTARSIFTVIGGFLLGSAYSYIVLLVLSRIHLTIDNGDVLILAVYGLWITIMCAGVFLRQIRICKQPYLRRALQAGIIISATMCFVFWSVLPGFPHPHFR